jgi:hypothetical protein
MVPVQNLLSRKEVCALRGIDPSTLYRWERRLGLTFHGGRIKEGHLAFWLELVEAARRLRLPVREVLGLDRPEQEALLARAHVCRGAAGS